MSNLSSSKNYQIKWVGNLWFGSPHASPSHVIVILINTLGQELWVVFILL